MAYPNTSSHTQDSRNDSHADVTAQLRDLERQGGELARLAHWAAGALLIAFSLGSLISISHAAFVTFLAQAQAGAFDIPDGLSLVVNVLLVLAADIALLYAASVLRVLIAAQAPARERRVHIWAMIGASVLESSTYLYLAWQFDRPTTVFLWLIMIGRALAAPLFAAYLSMARPLPVAPRDVAYQAALASGKGVVRDVATLAADPDAPLQRKVRIYTASAMMTTTDRARFDDIIEAVSTGDSAVSTGGKELPLVLPSPELPPEPPTDQPPEPSPNGPQDGGRHDVASEPLTHYWPALTPWEPSSLPGGKSNGHQRGHSGGRERGNHSGNVYHPASRSSDRSAERASVRSVRAKKSGKLTGKRGRTMLANAARRHQRVEQVRAWLADGESVSKRRIRSAFGVDNDAATGILAEARRAALHAV